MAPVAVILPCGAVVQEAEHHYHLAPSNIGMVWLCCRCMGWVPTLVISEGPGPACPGRQLSLMMRQEESWQQTP